MVFRCGVIGLGRQAVEDHLPAMRESEMLELVCVCDVDKERTQKLSQEYGVQGFTSIDEMLEAHQLDIVIVAVPHSQYLSIIEKAAVRGINIIKEKPLAVSTEEARKIYSIVTANNVFLGITVQRRFNPIFVAFHQLKKRIGKIYSIEGRYTMNINSLDSGWRASKAIAGGGALIDMGYHFIDLLVWYFGVPQSITARLSRGNRENQVYDVEDTVHLIFDYDFNGDNDQKVVGNFVISRVYPKKEEKLIIYGSRGVIELERSSIRRLDLKGNEVERLERHQGEGWPSAAIDQLEYYAMQIAAFKAGQAQVQLSEHLKHIGIIEAAYQSDATSSSCNPILFIPKF